MSADAQIGCACKKCDFCAPKSGSRNSRLAPPANFREGGGLCPLSAMKRARVYKIADIHPPRSQECDKLGALIEKCDFQTRHSYKKVHRHAVRRIRPFHVRDGGKFLNKTEQNERAETSVSALFMPLVNYTIKCNTLRKKVVHTNLW